MVRPTTLVLLVALGASAQNYAPFPPLPKGRAAVVTGDGELLLGSGGGGMMRRTGGVWKDASQPGAKSITLKGRQIAFLDRDGLYYDPQGDGNWRRFEFATSMDRVRYAQDGKNLVAVVESPSGSSSGAEVFLARDSALVATTVFKPVCHAAALHGWRRLRRPGASVSYDWPSETRVWIDGGTIVASGYSQTWISQDTGATWPDSISGWTSGTAIHGDTIAIDQGTVRMSVDGGRTWTNRGVLPAGDRGSLKRAGGLLFVEVSGDDTIPALLRSADLGATWDTVYRGADNQDQVAWDGTWFYGRRYNEIVRFGAVGHEVVEVDSLLPPVGDIVRILPFGSKLLVLQKAATTGYREAPGRLWVWVDRVWTAVRDSVDDVGVLQTDSGPAAVIVHENENPWVGSWYQPASTLLSRDLAAWRNLSLDVQTRRIGTDSAGLLLGDTTGMILLKRDGATERLAAWTNRYSARWYHDLWRQGGKRFWSYQGYLFARGEAGVDTTAKMSGRIGSYVAGPVRNGFLCSDEANRPVRLGVPNTSWSYFMPNQACGGTRFRGDSLLVWGGTANLAVLDTSGKSRMWPLGDSLKVAQAAWVPQQALRSTFIYKDSVLVLADAAGRLYAPTGLVPTAVDGAARPTAGIAPIHDGIRLTLAAPGDVSVEIRRLDGSLEAVAWSGRLDAGAHDLALGRRGAGRFAVVRVDGVARGAVLLAPADR